MSDDIMKAALNEARRLLSPPATAREPVWPALAAAAFFAISALTFAYASLLSPPVETHIPPAIQASDVLRGVN